VARLVVGFAALAGLVALLAGCGGSSGPSVPTIGAARTFELSGFRPSAPVRAGVPTKVVFSITQPSGAPLTDYRRGAGPHTGIHLIFVRSDLGAIVHHHPAVGADGTLSDRVVFPTPGRWRVVVDAYPASGEQPNFQLFRWIDVKGKAPAESTPPFERTQVVDGYRFAVKGVPRLRAVQAGTFEVDVTGPDGTPARFQPWFGATAHAIFFRKGDLAYFHTHICGAGQRACAATAAGAPVSGTSSKPGQLRVGVLLPQGGTWRMFLQTRAGGRVLTAPFTLKVAPA
jgi:hypothetical protein